MKLKVQVVSSERVKPSSPTPPHFRRYDMSFLDQLAPPVYMPMVLFFPRDPGLSLSNRQISDQLKTSLAGTLALYRPFAGALREPDLAVDCDDSGALFVEAEAEAEISEVLEDFDAGEMNGLLAVEVDDRRASELPVAAMATFFRCGGVAVSLCVNHKIADALTFFMFLNAWSAISRGDRDAVRSPVFGAGRLFPAREISGFTASYGIVKNDVVVKRFVFDAQSIAELRVRYEDKTSAEYTRRPTRVEALSAFIWHRMIAVTAAAAGKLCTMLHAVNLRTRTDPPLPETFFGNLSRIAVSVPSPDPDFTTVTRIRDSIREIDADFVEKLRDGGDDHLGFLRRGLAQVSSGEVVSFSFTSLCRFPIYEADFGWGKPAFVGSARLGYKNLVSFFDTRFGGGIEAWVNMRTEDMARFEADEEVLAFSSPNYYSSSNKGKSVI